jgi:glycosyltransferase involved in cell wall biosynthesis
MVAEPVQSEILFHGAKMKIALFDYRLTRNNPAGSCHLRMLEPLCVEHEFTVFSVEFENPCPERIRWVRVFAPLRPLALLFVCFHILAPLYYAWHRLFRGVRFDLVQFVESNLSFGDIVYAHCCHRMFLQRYWREVGASGWRGALRWLDHWLHALLEPRAYRNAQSIVVPSRGFARELIETYPSTAAKIRVVANAVDLHALRCPPDFDRHGFRKDLNLEPSDIAVAFVALGHYELKGLPLLLSALANSSDRRLKLLVVGGSQSLVGEYRKRADNLGLNGNVTFLGNQKDVRPYLWSADVLAHPSRHEVFPLATLEAAAAGLPLLVTNLNGVEEFFRDGENGLLLHRDEQSIKTSLERFAQIPAGVRHAMGERAQTSVQQFNVTEFARNWLKFYAEVGAHDR